MSTVISVENLGKKYIIGHQQQEPYLTLRDTLAEKFKETGRRLLHPFLSSSGQPLIGLANTEEFWALKDVSFEVQQGDRIGVIGRNGAGKTTLLKLLSRITEPTTGRFAIKGRVASLLEVGTGFHPELTGRENVFLNGAILGMRKTEIRKKFDEIIAFADVEKFLDTPVKRYSSGMYVRLAFAVAAHLEPDILIVDEVLAVGDAAFQKKCLGKMAEAAEEGRTVLFVSHNMGAVETLCSRGVLLKQGQLGFLGSARQTVSNYLVENYAGNDNPFENCSRSGNGLIKISSFHLESLDNDKISMVRSGDSAIFVIGFQKMLKDVSHVSVGISLHAENETGLFLNYSHFAETYFDHLPQEGYFKCLIRDIPLAPGNYLIGLRVLSGGEEADWPKVYIPVAVSIGDFYGTSTVETQLSSWGYFLVRGTWSVSK